MAYCTVADIVGHLGVEDTADDALIQGYVDAAQAWIDRYCHRTFEALENETRYVDARGDHLRGRVLYIDRIGELAEIDEIINGDGVEVTEYVTTPRNSPPYYAIRIKAMSGLFWTWVDDWEEAIAITGKWAYSVSPPEAIRQACIQLAAFYYRQKDQPFSDVTAVEAGVVIRPIGIPAAIKALITPYVKP